MRFLLFAALVGLTACSQGNASQPNIEPLPSVLVPEGHEHDWFKISLQGKPAILADRAYDGFYQNEQGSYPKILARVYASQSTDSAFFADSVIGIDCARSQVAPIDAFFADDEGGQGERAPKTEIEFRSVKSMLPTTRDAIFTHVCGPEWSYRASQ